MEPGRELDKLVAQKVMGAFVRQNEKGLYDLVIPGGVNQVDFVEADDALEASPPYSTDIAAAWEVVERLADGSHGGFDCGIDWDGGWWACFEEPGGNKYHVENQDTAPQAICLAALDTIR